MAATMRTSPATATTLVRLHDATPGGRLHRPRVHRVQPREDLDLLGRHRHRRPHHDPLHAFGARRRRQRTHVGVVAAVVGQQRAGCRHRARDRVRLVAFQRQVVPDLLDDRLRRLARSPRSISSATIASRPCASLCTRCSDISNGAAVDAVLGRAVEVEAAAVRSAGRRPRSCCRAATSTCTVWPLSTTREAAVAVVETHRLEVDRQAAADVDRALPLALAAQREFGFQRRPGLRTGAAVVGPRGMAVAGARLAAPCARARRAWPRRRPRRAAPRGRRGATRPRVTTRSSSGPAPAAARPLLSRSASRWRSVSSGSTAAPGALAALSAALAWRPSPSAVFGPARRRSPRPRSARPRGIARRSGAGRGGGVCAPAAGADDGDSPAATRQNGRTKDRRADDIGGTPAGDIGRAGGRLDRARDRVQPRLDPDPGDDADAHQPPATRRPAPPSNASPAAPARRRPPRWPGSPGTTAPTTPCRGGRAPGPAPAA